MKKIKVLIPAGGEGRRFANSEFTQLKPFIKINNKTIFEWIIINLSSKKWEIEYQIIIQEKYKTKYEEDIKYLERTYNLNFIYINLLTEGTTTTALFSYDWINNDTPLMIVNCDQIVNFDFDKFVDLTFKNKGDGSMLIFDEHEKSSKWSYVEIQQNKITNVVAKNAITSHGVVGWYFYVKGKSFIKAAISQIISLQKTNNEYYICPTFNNLISLGMNIIPIHLDNDDCFGVGTPEDLRKFISQDKHVKSK